jgi:hypothetical protein
LQKNKAALSWLFALIFPKAYQNKMPEQLVDAFSVDTNDTIVWLAEVLLCLPSSARLSSCSAPSMVLVRRVLGVLTGL